MYPPLGDSVEKYQQELYKMIFIYNTLINGWTVKMLEENKFQFTNTDKGIRNKYFSKSFLNDFVENNFVIDDIIMK